MARTAAKERAHLFLQWQGLLGSLRLGHSHNLQLPTAQDQRQKSQPAGAHSRLNVWRPMLPFP